MKTYSATLGMVFLCLVLSPSLCFSQQNSWASSENLFFSPTPFKNGIHWVENNPAGFMELNNLSLSAVNYFGLSNLNEIKIKTSFGNESLRIGSYYKHSTLLDLFYNEGGIALGRKLNEKLQFGIQGGLSKTAGPESGTTIKPFVKAGINLEHLNFQYGLVIGGEKRQYLNSTSLVIPYSFGVKFDFIDSFGIGLTIASDDKKNQGTILNFSFNENQKHCFILNLNLANYNFSTSYIINMPKISFEASLYVINQTGINQSATTSLIL